MKDIRRNLISPTSKMTRQLACLPQSVTTGEGVICVKVMALPVQRQMEDWNVFTEKFVSLSEPVHQRIGIKQVSVDMPWWCDNFGSLKEENIIKCVQKRVLLSDINHSKIFYDPPPRVMEIKAKINKWDLLNLKAVAQWRKLQARWNKAAFRMGENNSKQSNWERINHHYIQAAHIAQFQKNKRPNQKVGQRTKQTGLQRRHTDG